MKTFSMVVFPVAAAGECRILITADSEEGMSGLTVSAVVKKRGKANYVIAARDKKLSILSLFPVR